MNLNEPYTLRIRTRSPSDLESLPNLFISATKAFYAVMLVLIKSVIEHLAHFGVFPDS